MTMRYALPILVLLLAVRGARADGGTVRASRVVDGYRVTVFTSPTPVRVGVLDCSVLIQDAATGRPRLDVPVVVRAHHSGDPLRRTGGPATTEAATNKLFLAVPLEIGEAGRWDVEVVVGKSGETSRLEFALEVEEASLPWLDLAMWIGWPAVVVLLFVTHQRARRNR